jgi:hypothetical protein
MILREFEFYRLSTRQEHNARIRLETFCTYAASDLQVQLGLSSAVQPQGRVVLLIPSQSYHESDAMLYL